MDEIKLCYIWVEKYRNFEAKGINFSSSEKFHYDVTINSLTKSIVVKLPANFYGRDIVDVTAIVGKNGAGKSNALELVCKLLKGGKSSIRGNFIIILKKNESFVCLTNFDNFSPTCNFKIEVEPYVKNIDPLKIIYFSNVFDERMHKFDKDVSDLSANYRYKQSRYPWNLSNKQSDFAKQLNFIERDIFKQTGIDVPTKIQIISKVWNRQINTQQERSIFGDFYNELKNFQTTFRNRVHDIVPNNKLHYLLVYSFFIETLKYLRKFSINNGNNADYYLNEYIQFTGLYKNEKTESMVQDMLKWMGYISHKLSDELYIRNDDFKNFKDHLALLQDLKSFTDYLEFEYDYEGKGNRNIEVFHFNFSISDKNLIRKYVFLFEENSLFEVNWLGLSSGHRAYLNIFSLIHHEVKRVKKENLLLCIDEGDLYLHPKWQIEFFDKLITIIPKIFEGRIQIILTSHSPFLLSDLPRQNITIIDNNKIIEGVDLKYETFAGNIYNLYEEPFFLNDQRVSTFAQKKINLILEKLKKGDGTEIEKYISLIGDDVIRYHLERRLKND